MAEVHGKRLLPSTVDNIAQRTPNKAWASVQSEGSSAFTDISYATFANAINRIGHWIVDNVGATSAEVEEPQVLAYIGASDLRYYVLCMATVKAGYVPLLISHLNSEAANTFLFEAVNCKTLLCGLDNLNGINIDQSSVRIMYIPTYGAAFDQRPVTAFPYTRTYENAVGKPLMVRMALEDEERLLTNSVGSTGMPKPITYTHGWYTAADSSQDIPDFEGHESEPRTRALRSRHFLGFPPFHPAGLASGLRDSVYFGTTIVFPRHNRPMNAAAVVDAIEHGNIDGAALLPHVLEEMAKSSEALEKIKKMKYIDWVGGPIPQEAGDLISARTTLNNAYASTELGSAALLNKKDPTLWQWYFFNPQANGFDFRPIPGDNDLFELFVVKNPALDQAVFRIFPHLDEWPMKDLFTPHPTLPHHWRLTGRADDLIVFQNGSKIHPSSIEAAVKRAPGVRDCIMFQSGRVRAGVLIEPTESGILGTIDAKNNFINDTFAFVEESNRRVPENGIVVREMLLLTSKEKPFPRTGKGTVQRQAAIKLYAKEIDALYEELPSELKEMKDYRIGSQVKQ